MTWEVWEEWTKNNIFCPYKIFLLWIPGKHNVYMGQTQLRDSEKTFERNVKKKKMNGEQNIGKHRQSSEDA